MKSSAFTGRYAFHLHTDFVDGHSTVQDYFAAAKTLKIDRLVFLEHIRRTPSYAVDDYAARVRECAAESGIGASVGLEAKILPGGALDITDEDRAKADVIGLAEHGIRVDDGRLVDLLFAAIEQCAATPSAAELVWVHPGLWLRRRGLMNDFRERYVELLQFAVARGVLLERNTAYGLVPDWAADRIPPQAMVVGVNAHSASDLSASPPGQAFC